MERPGESRGALGSPGELWEALGSPGEPWGPLAGAPWVQAFRAKKLMVKGFLVFTGLNGLSCYTPSGVPFPC